MANAPYIKVFNQLTSTKTNLIGEYERLLKATFPWAQDEAKLARFMANVKQTLHDRSGFDRTGECFKQALKQVGLPASISLKALRALPD